MVASRRGRRTGGQYFHLLAVGDFNGDGIADLAVTNEDHNDVSILLGDGHGGFARPRGLRSRRALVPFCGRRRLQ